MRDAAGDLQWLVSTPWRSRTTSIQSGASQSARSNARAISTGSIRSRSARINLRLAARLDDSPLFAPCVSARCWRGLSR